MDKPPHTPQTLCPDHIDQTQQLLNWWTLIRSSTNSGVKFNHTDSRICSVILGKELYESAQAYSQADPQYKSFSNMVELLIWRELGSKPEFLEPAPPAKDKNQDVD